MHEHVAVQPRNEIVPWLDKIGFRRTDERRDPSVLWPLPTHVHCPSRLRRTPNGNGTDGLPRLTFCFDRLLSLDQWQAGYNCRNIDASISSNPFQKNCPSPEQPIPDAARHPNT